MKTKKDNTSPSPKQENNITRKEALKKAGKYAAFTAAGMMLILKPTKSYAGSPPQNPGFDW